MTNDNPISSILPPPPVAMGNPEIIAMLERTLAQVKAGKVAGIVIVTSHGSDALSIQTSGMFPCTLAAGCTQAANQLISSMFNQKRSSIIAPRM